MVNVQGCFSLLYLHILWPKDRHFAIVAQRLVGDDHVNLDGARSAGLLLRGDDPRSESQQSQCNQQCEQVPEVVHASSESWSRSGFQTWTSGSANPTLPPALHATGS